MNRPVEAVAHVSRAMDLGGAFSAEQLADLQSTFKSEGASAFFRKQAAYAQQLNERGKYRSPVLIAMPYAAAGDRDAALSWLEKAVDERAPWLPELKMEPMYDPLRSDPRFTALLKRVGLEK
jgi:hypothetical protein